MHFKASLASRKFIDLIHKVSAKWANWDPPYSIKVGDYGKIDEQSGEFTREGNIYDDIHILCTDEKIIKLVRDNPPVLAPRENVYTAASDKVRRGDFKLSAGVQVVGLADASIKGQWAFGSDRGALLIMAHPRSSRIPPANLLKHLADVQLLRNMCLVTEVFSCPAYSFYLSSKSGEAVDVALLGSSPIPQAPGVKVHGEIETKWWSQNTSGLFRSAGEANGKDDYTPLYALKEVPKRSFFRDGQPPPPEPEGDDRWSDVLVPWEPLDEDGVAEEFEDTVFD